MKMSIKSECNFKLLRIRKSGFEVLNDESSVDDQYDVNFRNFISSQLRKPAAAVSMDL